MIEAKMKEMGISLPEAPKPLASYIPAMVVDNLVFTAGQVPLEAGKMKYEGKAGENVSLEDAQNAAKLCAVNCLSVVKSAIGSLDKIKRIVKITVFVASGQGFTDQPKVANGASDFLVDLFGEEGKHVRSAVGVSELPLNATVEIEMIAEIEK
ncbi:MAG: RidA family protein [Melioribacteraceae bacterium]|nr:RidA family protein [Melioribacteraceae bacterium]